MRIEIIAIKFRQMHNDFIYHPLVEWGITLLHVLNAHVCNALLLFFLCCIHVQYSRKSSQKVACTYASFSNKKSDCIIQIVA